jgi:CIC family chloride channel protein
VLVASGVGAGIAATFNTPLGGILFAIELMLVEISARTLVPVALATGAATFIGRLFFGASPSFDIPELAHATSTIMTPYMFLIYIIFGCILGLAAMIFSHALYKAEDLFDRMPGNYYTRHMTGMLLVGILMYVMMEQLGHYYIQGVGYATIQDILVGALSNPALLALLFVGKILANALTIGSGGSGGIFSPSLFLGATLGAAFGVAANSLFPGLEINPAHFAIIGMAAIVGAGTGAVITAIVMIFEMTRNYDVIVPLIITVSIAYGMRRYLMRDSIYIYKLALRGHYIPDSLGTNMFMLRPVEDFLETSCLFPTKEGQTIREIRKELKDKTTAPYVLLTDGPQVKSVLYAVKRRFIDTKGHRHSTIRKHLTSHFIVTSKNDIIFDVVAKLRTAHCKIALVTSDGKLDQPDEVIGALSLDDIAHTSHLAKYIIASKK